MDRKRVTVIRIGPVISTKKRKHCTEMCGAFLFYPKRDLPLWLGASYAMLK